MTLTADLGDLDLLLPYAHPSVAYARALEGVLAPRHHWSPGDLGRVVRQFARHASGELNRVARFDADSRWYLRLALTHDVEVRLVTWTPGQGTGPHDHSGASGAYTVLYGELTETWKDGADPSRRTRRTAGAGSAYGPDRVHTLTNEGSLGAISVHAYSPPLLPLGVDVTLEEPAG
jgi:hypothetical protein